MIIEYKLHILRHEGLVAPPWVTAPGYFFDPDNNTYIGFVSDNAPFKVPETVRRYPTLAALQARCQNLHVRYPFTDADGTDLTNGEVDTLVADTVTQEDIDGAGIALEQKTSVDATSKRAEIILVDNTDAARTITIDSDDIARKRYLVTIKDTSNGAGTNNITIATEGSETIDGSATAVISTNNGQVTLYSDGTNLFIKS